MATVTIHPTALVEPGAELDSGVEVGPFCRISSKAKVGKGTKLFSHVVLDGDVSLGIENSVYPFAVLGGPPQDISYKGEPTRVVIGDRNVFRESSTVSRGTAKDKTVTTIGSDNYFMTCAHVGHDAVVGNKNVLVNCSALGGHCELGNYVTIGGLVPVTQRCRIGDHAFIGANAVVRRDVPPYMSLKDFSEVSGPNLIGLKRFGYTEDEVRMAREFFKTLYLGNQTTEKAMEEIEKLYGASPFARRFIDFVKGTKIGIQR